MGMLLAGSKDCKIDSCLRDFLHVLITYELLNELGRHYEFIVLQRKKPEQFKKLARSGDPFDKDVVMSVLDILWVLWTLLIFCVMNLATERPIFLNPQFESHSQERLKWWANYKPQTGG